MNLIIWMNLGNGKYFRLYNVTPTLVAKSWARITLKALFHFFVEAGAKILPVYMGSELEKNFFLA
jgi:hypothetical protein